MQTTEHVDAVLAEVRIMGTGASSGLVVEQTGRQLPRFWDGIVWFHSHGSHTDPLEAVGLAE